MKKFYFILLIIFIFFCARRKDENFPSFYRQELCNKSWYLKTSGGTYHFNFTPEKISFNIGRLAASFKIATDGGTNNRIVILEHRKKFVPFRWRLEEDGMLKITKLDRQKMYSTITDAMNSPEPSEWIGLYPE